MYIMACCQVAVLALCALTISAVAEQSCSTNYNCSLNGECAGGSCKCDPGWTSEDCSVLDVIPHPNNYVPAYGFSPNITSWGGNAIKGDDGLYHMFVSEMAEGGLSGWGHESQIAHATAKSPMDVFVKKAIAIPKWSHNASPLRAPATHLINGTRPWYLFHIGTGFLHIATNPDGPWTQLPSLSCNNPAPMFHNNGTLYCGCNNGDFKIYRSDDPTKENSWVQVSAIHFPESWGVGEYIRAEDPYLWMNAKGSWHFLAHVYDYRDGWPPNPNQTEPVLVAGHGFSDDGINWDFSNNPPYFPWVTYEDGRRVNYSTYERPHLVFNANGDPTYALLSLMREMSRLRPARWKMHEITRNRMWIACI
eukprot:m.480684 g.480684  ORF g.480684 m.480684 type:complete len:363 (+) comp21710_c1_seq1:255-1343(+)